MYDPSVTTPLCACGCGREVGTNARTKRFNKYLVGHSGGVDRKLPEKPCGGCGKPIYPLWASGKPRKYCDNACYRRATRPYDKRVRQREWFLKARYGLSPAEFDSLLAAQGGGCAICRRKEHGGGRRSLYVDHDHKTGRVRGILCSSCNRAIGFLRDDPDLFRAAARYLEKDD